MMFRLIKKLLSKITKYLGKLTCHKTRFYPAAIIFCIPFKQVFLHVSRPLQII